MSNETKIGLFAVIVIAIFIWGYKFLKGQNVFTTSRLFYVEYQQVNQLAASAPVFINGFQVGVVSNMYLKPEDMKTIVAVMNIDRGVQVPKNTIANIISTGFVSGPAIELSFDQACNGANCAESGDYLKGGVRGALESLVGQDELDVYMGKLGEGVGNAMDVVNQKIADPNPDNEIGKTMRDLQASVKNLKVTTDNLNRMMARSSGNIDGILKNLNSVSGTMSDSQEDIRKMLANASVFSEQLAKINMAATIDTANLTLHEAKEAIIAMKATLKSTQSTMESANTLVAKLNEGEGTIGKMMTDPTLYNQMSAASARLDSFLIDFENRPYRYMPLKSRRRVKKFDRKDAQGQ